MMQKGSVTTLVFNFFLQDPNRNYFILSCALAALYVLVQKKGEQELLHKSLLWICSIVILLLIYRHRSPLINYLILFTLAYLWIEVVNLQKNKSGYDVFLIFFALAYANTLTSDISMEYLFIVTAFLIGKMLTYCESNFTTNKFKILTYTLLVLVFTAHVRDKYNFPYSWWGSNQK